MVKTTGSIRRMLSFVDELRQNPQFQLLRLLSNQHNGGMDILMRLEEPMLVKPALLVMKEVSHVETSSEPAPPGEEEYFTFPSADRTAAYSSPRLILARNLMRDSERHGH